jgi:endonuclease-8
MPEGPEIRRAADKITAILIDQHLEDVFFARDVFPSLARRARKLVGQHVLSVDTHGKAMLTRLSGGLTIYSHNQLYGRWRISERGVLPDINRSLRMALHTARHSALLYSASDIELLNTKQVAQHRFLSRLGPDVLDQDLNWKTLRDRAISKEFYRRSLAALYVDQHFLAGSGDYLRSEILFAARVNPRHKPGEMSGNALSKLCRQTLTIAQRSYKNDGITNTPRLAASLRTKFLAEQKTALSQTPQSIDNESWRFGVFRREGKPCHQCSTPIARTRIGGRALYYCPKCQPNR